MSGMLEIFTEIMFDLAIGIMIFKILKNINRNNSSERFSAITMGIGFLMYCALKAVNSGSCASVILALLGFMLSYSAFIFTLSRE